MGERSGFDLKQELHQKLTGRNTTQRFSRLGVRCEHCVAGKMPDLPYKLRSSDRDVIETQMDYFYMNRRTDSELMTVLNFLGCESGCAFPCAVEKSPRDFLVSVFAKDWSCAAGRVSWSERTRSMLSLLESRRCAKQERRKPSSKIRHSTRQPAWVKLIEVVHRLVEGPIRTIRGRLEQVLKIETNIKDPIVPWVVRRASFLLYWYRVKLDVYPSYRVSKGRPYGGKNGRTG